MIIEVFALCDAATSDSGKLNVLGAFDTVIVKEFPAEYYHCAIAIRIRFDRIERGDHKITVNVIDFDGGHVLPPAEATIHAEFSDDQRSGSANLILNIQRLKFEKVGEYSINLAIDGRSEHALPLFVRQHT